MEAGLANIRKLSITEADLLGLFHVVVTKEVTSESLSIAAQFEGETTTFRIPRPQAGRVDRIAFGVFSAIAIGMASFVTAIALRDMGASLWTALMLTWPWAFGAFGIWGLTAILHSFFGREEIIVTGDEVQLRWSLGPWVRAQRIARAAVRAVRRPKAASRAFVPPCRLALDVNGKEAVFGIALDGAQTESLLHELTRLLTPMALGSPQPQARIDPVNGAAPVHS